MDFSDLSRLASSHVAARLLHVAVNLGVFDLLEDRAVDAPAVASALNTDARATELFLNALVAIELLHKKRGFYSLTPLARAYLVRSAPKYFGAMVRFESLLWDCWGGLESSIRSGKPARTADMYQQNPAETECFIQGMHALVAARGDAEVLADTLNFSGVTSLLDVGSGPGTYPIVLCRRYPKLRVTIFDLPATLAITRRLIAAAELESRITLADGDYRTDPVPGTHQVAFLSNIIHAESSEENARLVGKLYHSLDKNGRIVVKDHILQEDHTHPEVGAVFSMLMLLTTSAGRCYSFGEVRGWMAGAGFEEISELALPQPLTSSLVIGKKP